MTLVLALTAIAGIAGAPPTPARAEPQWPGAGVTSQPTTADAVRLASGLMAVVFPEWHATPQQLTFSVHTGLYGVGDLTFQVLDGHEDPAAIAPLTLRREDLNQTHVRALQESTFLAGQMTFRSAQEIEMVHWSGRAVMERERNVLRDRINAHPEWSDAEVAACVRGAGVKFGPDDREALLAHFNRLNLTPFFGKVAKGRIRQAFFHLRERDQLDAGAGDFARAEWSIVLDGGPDSMALSIEPFQGHIVLVVATRRATREPPARKQPGS